MLQTAMSLAVRGAARVLYGTKHLGAAVSVGSPSGDRIVLVRKPGGLWALPGGFSARSEQPWRTAVREVLEETGLEVTVSRQPQAVVVKGPHVHFLFSAVLEPDAGVSVLPPVTRPRATAFLRRCDAAEARWFPVAELPALTRITVIHLAALSKRPNPA